MNEGNCLCKAIRFEVDQKASWHEITDDLPLFGGETGMERLEED